MGGCYGTSELYKIAERLLDEYTGGVDLEEILDEVEEDEDDNNISNEYI